MSEIKTKKTNKVIMLPEVREYIIQPNRITNAIYNYTLYQERIFTAILYYLQEPINNSMKNQPYNQLSMFSDTEVKLQIPLREIAGPSEYRDVKKALKEMASIVLEVPYKDLQKQNWIEITNMFTARIPDKGNYSKNIEIVMKTSVAARLIEIDKDHNSRAINYTRFVYQIAQRAENKYTSRLYKIISSWKKKGGFVIKLNVLKEALGIGDKYPTYKDFKKRVLLPVFEELYEKSDCWFNCKAADFEVRDRQTVTHLNFKVITPELALMDDKRTEYIRSILKDHFLFKNNDLDAIASILNNRDIDRGHILNKIMQIADVISNDRGIIHKAPYALKSLLNAFPH